MSFNNGLFEPERRRTQEKSMRLFAKEVAPRFRGCKPPIDPLAIDLSTPEPVAGPTERIVYN